MLPRVLRRALAVLACALLSAAPAGAGEGAIEDGHLDLLVYFAYDEPDVTSWEPVFTEYSKRLSNATEGGLQLGTVSFTKCEDLRDRADVWILNDFSGARAHLRGLGVTGRHMTISQIHKNTTSPVLGQFGLVHETGHYVWGVYDEYKGFVGNTPASDPDHYCVDESGSVSCVMDGGTTITPNNMRREFCTRGGTDFPVTGHFRGSTNGMGFAVRNDQEYYLGRSCWEQIAASGVGGLAHPLEELDSSFPAHQDVVFDTSRLNGTLAVALVLDKSGSMSAEEKLEQMIVGAQMVVGLLEEGDFLTIVAFDDRASVLMPATLVNDAVKDAALAIVAEVEAEGGTAIGRGVLSATEQLDSVFGCREILIVISDGVSLPPAANHASVLAAVAAQNGIAYGIALGAFPDDGALAALSSATGGTFFKSPTADQLTGVLDSVIAQAGGGIPITEETGIAPALGSVEETFDVNAFASGVRVSLAHGATAELELVLTDPIGQTFALGELPPQVSSYASAVQTTISVPAPEVGTWTATISELGGADVVYDFLAYLEAGTLDVTARSPDAVPWPEPLRVEVQVVAGVPAGGARVSGTVERPDGSHAAVSFFDDGQDVHGDEKADDGVYSLLFAAYAGSGAYRFDIEVDGFNTIAASNQECGVFGLGEDGQSFDPLDPFSARLTHTALLEGFPQSVRSGALEIEAHPDVADGARVAVAGAPPTPVAGFVLSVSDDEPVRLDELAFDVTTDERAAALAGLALHRDADGDGRVDRPSIPVARAAVTPSGRLVFTRGSVFAGAQAPIALLEPGSSTAFLVTAGEALADVAAASASPSGEGAREADERVGTGGTFGYAPTAVPPGSAGAGALATLAALGAAWLLGTARRRRRRLAAAFALAVAGLTVPACREGAGSTSGGVTVPPDFEITLVPAGVSARGTVTGDAPTGGGEPVVYGFGLD